VDVLLERHKELLTFSVRTNELSAIDGLVGQLGNTNSTGPVRRGTTTTIVVSGRLVGTPQGITDLFNTDDHLTSEKDVGPSFFSSLPSLDDIRYHANLPGLFGLCRGTKRHLATAAMVTAIDWRCNQFVPFISNRTAIATTPWTLFAVERKRQRDVLFFT
jgi:hypothetical protein